MSCLSCLSCFLVEFLKEMVRMEIYIYIYMGNGRKRRVGGLNVDR